MKKVILLSMFFSFPVFAQQQSPMKAIDRISISFGQCVGGLEQQKDMITELQKKLNDANSKIKDLEALGKK